MKLSKETTKIQRMFSSIAPRYDLLNRILSIGRDRYWRRFAVSQLPESGIFLDVATGTGDIAIEILKRHSSDVRVIGIDFSDAMLDSGEKKIKRLGYQRYIHLCLGDVSFLPFRDETFDGAIIAFGIRNLPDYRHGIQEMARVVRPNGKVIILEFTNIHSRLFRQPYYLYLTKVLPLIGEIISGRKGAYRYLSQSVLDFPNPEELREIMQSTGLRDVKYHLLTFGITAVHVGIKQ
mgnify:CR=1 FL=1